MFENRHIKVLQSYLGPPIPSFLRKHPHFAKGKSRDTVIQTEAKYAGRKIRK